MGRRSNNAFRWLLATSLGGGFWLLPGFGEPVPVQVVQERGVSLLLREGRPYFIRGAGGDTRLELLAATGGNSLRTWGDNPVALLDEAHAAGLTVCVGLWVDHERHGFDYADEAAVAAQIARHCAVIDRLKDHPAVLLWSIGNEVELQYTNLRVWDVIEAVAAHAKRVDPHHPTMTVIAHAPAEVVREIQERCPSIDILGCNSYGGIGILAGELRAAGWDKPYIVTEWGPDGGWEVDKTAWGAEIEEGSTGKAVQLALRYARIAGDHERCLGSYIFYWGNKQEITPTWFGLFLEDGSRTESVETLQYLWTGSLPEARAPRITALRINGQGPQASLVLKPGSEAEAVCHLLRGDWEQLQVRWELTFESTDKRFGGDREERPQSVATCILEQGGGRLRFKVPQRAGAYRLFLTVRGDGDTAATANFPFLVK